MLTADTITDDQIREVMREAQAFSYPGADPKWREQWNAGKDALDCPHVYATSADFYEQKRAARGRCAEILNARLASRIRDLRENGPRTIDYLNNCDMALAALRGEFGAGHHMAEQALAWCTERISARAKEQG